MPYNKAKFTELLLHAAWHLREDAEGGATVLNKVLYYAEFGHMRQYGQTISGANYFRLPDGPAPRALLPVRQELIAAGRATLIKTPFNGLMQDRLIPREEPTVVALSDSEQQSLREALILLKGKTAREASDLSHLEPGWRFVDDYEVIPPESAFLAATPMVTDAVRVRAEELSASLNS